MRSDVKTRKTVRNCASEFKFVCPRLWEKLQATDDPSVRFCDGCKKDVHYCHTDEETIRHAQAGHCIARERPDPSEGSHLIVGEPAEPVVSPANAKEADRWEHRESGIDKSIEDVKYSHRSCPSCGYPAPDWRPKCSVCETHLGRV